MTTETASADTGGAEDIATVLTLAELIARLLAGTHLVDGRFWRIACQADGEYVTLDVTRLDFTAALDTTRRVLVHVPQPRTAHEVVHAAASAPAPDNGTDRIDDEILDAEIIEALTHDEGCWRHHDDCALRRAEAQLVDLPVTQSSALLELIRLTLSDHAGEPCPDPGECYGVQAARRVLDGSASGGNDGATDNHDSDGVEIGASA